VARKERTGDEETGTRATENGAAKPITETRICKEAGGRTQALDTEAEVSVTTPILAPASNFVPLFARAQARKQKTLKGDNWTYRVFCFWQKQPWAALRAFIALLRGT
jgi:hypothetical protein